MRNYLSSTRKVYQDYCTKLEFRPVNESSDEESEVESNEDVTEAEFTVAFESVSHDMYDE